MSDQQDHFDGTDAAQPEYLGASEPTTDKGNRRWGVIGAASVAVVAAVGASAWGVTQFLAPGDSAASAVPADAVAYVSVDLDPSAGQKIQALTTLKKFPALAEELDLGVRDDLRRWVFESIQEEGSCRDLDYDAKVAPWLGDRMAVAFVPGDDGTPDPLLVFQVSDKEAARSGAEAIGTCAGEDVAAAFVGDYMLLSEKQKDVDAMAASAEESSLADDAGFGRWMDEVGDPGIVTAYASADLPTAIFDTQFAEDQQPAAEDLRELYADFEGAAGVLRFADGSIEAEAASGGLPAGLASGAGVPTLATLPGSTAAALSMGLPDGWLSDYTSSIQNLMGEEMRSDEMWDGLEGSSGLDLPGDIETLLGNGVTISLDSSADLTKFFEAPEPSDLPVGVRISGDPDEIRPVLDKLIDQGGELADLVTVENTDDGVTVGLSPDYVDDLVAGGDLGSSELFGSVVPDADKASAVFYLDFDADNEWSRELADELSSGDQDVVDNVEPLGALGMSSWVDGDVSHARFRLTTD